MCHYNTIQTLISFFIMPFERKLSVNFVDELRDQFGNNIDASHVKKFATAQGCAYPTVARKLKAYQVKKGTWNLTIEEGRQILEKAIASPTVLPTIDQNLIPQEDQTLLSLVLSLMSKRLLHLRFSILHSSQVYQVMVRHSL